MFPDMGEITAFFIILQLFKTISDVELLVSRRMLNTGWLSQNLHSIKSYIL